ncbi:MAG: hypothetical protein J5802_11770 [Butyrivibrio sp.]|nr:hypothetical protein [Butyrivibrio sp.]
MNIGNEYAEDYCDYDEETGAYMSYKIDGTEFDKQTYDETLNNIYDKNSSRHLNNDDFREKEELISALK